MIPNQWYVILESREVKRGKITRIVRMGEKMIAWRNSLGEISVLADKCPHRGAAMSVGRVHGNVIACPFHGIQFDVNGKCTLVPANGWSSEPPKALNIHSYPTREANGFVYIWWGAPRSYYPPLPWFESISDSMSYSTLKDHWKNHYSRAIENQLDVVHLPFIHATTIGRGNRTLVNGPIAREEPQWPGDHLLNLWVNNEVDKGQKPKKASELPEPIRRPFLQFRYGNLWHNWISESIRVLVAFAPIDDGNSMLYLRFYHNLRIPVIRKLVGWIGSISNLIIERQDRRVVITQRPTRPDLGIGEILIPGDNPIVLYRKIRQSLIQDVNKE